MIWDRLSQDRSSEHWHSVQGRVDSESTPSGTCQWSSRLRVDSESDVISLCEPDNPSALNRELSYMAARHPPVTLILISARAADTATRNPPVTLVLICGRRRP